MPLCDCVQPSVALTAISKLNLLGGSLRHPLPPSHHPTAVSFATLPRLTSQVPRDQDVTGMRRPAAVSGRVPQRAALGSHPISTHTQCGLEPNKLASLSSPKNHNPCLALATSRLPTHSSVGLAPPGSGEGIEEEKVTFSTS